jgi:hypothetical protein
VTSNHERPEQNHNVAHNIALRKIKTNKLNMMWHWSGEKRTENVETTNFGEKKIDGGLCIEGVEKEWVRWTEKDR